MGEINYSNTNFINGLASWLIAALMLIAGFRYIKEIFEFVLLKLYEIFIQKRPM
jgi:hypothetical protein